MQLTFGECIDRTLKYHLNVGNDAATYDSAQRLQAAMYGQEIATSAMRLAPWRWRLASAAVAITNDNNYATMPANFYHPGDSMVVSVAGQYGRFLTYKEPQELLQIRRTQQLASSNWPLYYSFFGNDSTGTPYVQFERAATGSISINFDGYVIKTPEMIDRPGACTVAAAAGTGALTGTYYYKVVFTTASGDCELGVSSSSLALSAQNGSLTAIPTSPNHTVTSRKLYRNKAADPLTFYLLATIADNVTTTYTDSTLDASLVTAAPAITAAITGMEVFPPDMAEQIFVRGMAKGFAWNRGDTRAPYFLVEWEKEIKRFWGELQEHNEPRALPSYGTNRSFTYPSLRSRFNLA